MSQESRRATASGKRAKKKKSVWIYNVLIAICALITVFCALMVFLETRDYREGDSAYDQIAALAVRPRQTADANVPVLPTEGEGDDGDADVPAVVTRELAPIEVDFSMLTAVKGAVAAWLYGEGTGLDYPVAAAPNNSYYLNHLLDGTNNRMGTLFIDYDNAPDFSDRNTVIHGHHMKNGSMFGSLNLYKEQSYFDAHPYLYLLTPEGDYRLELIAGYTTKAAKDGYEKWFIDDAAFLAFVEGAQRRSNFVSPVIVEAGDRLVTLSTCAYEFESARYVLHARMVPLP